jgi:hypothetical protein
MNNRQLGAVTLLIATLLFIVALTTSFVEAAPTAPTTLTTVQSSSRDLSTVAAQSASAQGGNVTEINIAAITITKSWQGYYGNITGQITLQDGNNNTFYNWSLTSMSGRVYATRNGSISWAVINCTNAGNRTNEETYLGQVASDSDSVSNTYSGSSHPAFNVSTSQINTDSCYTTRGYVNNNSQGANYTMILLQSRSDIIYTGIMNKSVVGFDGRQHDFELLVGENERSGSIGVTPYYFYTEFN